MARSADTIYQFKITLQGVRPPVWRRIHVPKTFTFWELNSAMQDAMGWTGYHLHEFVFGNSDVEIGMPADDNNPCDEGLRAGWGVKIARYFPRYRKCRYIYDFGDDWEHVVEFEKDLPIRQGMVYPICVKGKRACPPEDCGGPWGYAELLKVLANPSSKGHKEALEWVGEDFDPELFDPSTIKFSNPAKRLEDYHEFGF